MSYTKLFSKSAGSLFIAPCDITIYPTATEDDPNDNVRLSYLASIGIPSDAQIISDDLYTSLMASVVGGDMLGVDAAGNPISVPHVLDATDARMLRDRYLNDVAWMVDRHSQQLQLSIATTLTQEQFTKLLQYIDALRNVPQQDGFPGVITWPVCPVPLEQ